MSVAEDIRPETALLEGLDSLMQEATGVVDGLFAKARAHVADCVREGGKISSAAIDREQHIVHGLAWFATYAETLRAVRGWYAALAGEGRLGELEQLIAQVCFGEYLNHIAGGIPMNGQEQIRLHELGVDPKSASALFEGTTGDLMREGSTPASRARLVELMVEAQANLTIGDCGLDEMLNEMRSQMNRFIEENVAPSRPRVALQQRVCAAGDHSETGRAWRVRLTLPEEYDGMGLGKESMCLVSEELSRGWIAIGSLGTRPEIAAELILAGGTDEQKQKWLPKIASGEILPTAVFTEPNTGSDLASLKTRAVKDGDVYKVTGNKTWITHPVRADVMTLLARTNPDEKGYKGLSMFLAEKPRGTDEDPFPAEGMSGGEIEVLGYRGMKEYEIRLRRTSRSRRKPARRRRGQGFKQLMQTFEGARIQTAARALGVAQSALDLGLRYALERIQFGKR
jgi:(2S)-methylsuccinyl-CoA dehydrogenase